MKKNLHILHLDDEPFELENLARALKASEGTPTFQVESCSSLDKYLVRLQGKSIPDIVILDIHLDSSVAGSASPVEETKRVWPDVVILNPVL
jgi:DNA-binding NarL/FixJ family response regulator